MKRLLTIALSAACCLLPLSASATLVGLWEFEDAGDLTKATIGADLVLNGTDAAVAGTGTGFDAGATLVGPGSNYTVTNPIGANGGGTYTNEYTILFDLNYPTAGIWRALYQTNTTNSNDGDYFIHPSDESWGTSELSYTDNATTGLFFSSANTWYRALLSVDLDNFYHLYIDGNLTGVHNVTSEDGRYALEDIFYVLADESGEDGDMRLSNLALYDTALDANAAAALGGAGRLIIPEPGTLALAALLALSVAGLRKRRV